jgi:hypothetical protein
MNAIAGSGMPPGVRVHVGTYGVNREASITVHTYGLGRYSPMFKAEVRTAAWEHRTLTPEEERKVGPRFAGRVPDESVLMRLSSAQRIAWGTEVGRRYRDTIRHARADGITVESWQLDELGTQLAGSQGRQHREFVRGVLQGISFGRKVLGDSEGKGWVWSTRRALNLARLPVTAELRAFWQQLDRAPFRILRRGVPELHGRPRESREGPGGRAASARGRRACAPPPRRPLHRGHDSRLTHRTRPRRQRQRALAGRGQPLAQRLRRGAGAHRSRRLRRVPLRVREPPRVRDAGRLTRRCAGHGLALTRSRDVFAARAADTRNRFP